MPFTDQELDDEIFHQYLEPFVNRFIDLVEESKPKDVPCPYCCTDWDCAALPSCSKSDKKYQYFLERGSDPRAKLGEK